MVKTTPNVRRALLDCCGRPLSTAFTWWTEVDSGQDYTYMRRALLDCCGRPLSTAFTWRTEVKTTPTILSTLNVVSFISKLSVQWGSDFSKSDLLSTGEIPRIHQNIIIITIKYSCRVKCSLSVLLCPRHGTLTISSFSIQRLQSDFRITRHPYQLSVKTKSIKCFMVQIKHIFQVSLVTCMNKPSSLWIRIVWFNMSARESIQRHLIINSH